jgi:phasin family protein
MLAIDIQHGYCALQHRECGNTSMSKSVKKKLKQDVKPEARVIVSETVKPKAVKSAAPAMAAPTKGTKVMTDTIKQVEETVKKATADTSAKASAMFQDLSARATKAMEKGTEISREAVDFHKANLEAVVESGKLAAKGAQTMGQNAAELSRKNFEAATAMLKTAAAVKSPTDFFKIQGDFVRGQFDAAVAEMTKATEFYTKLAGEITQPLQNRYTVAAEQVKTRMAA